MNVNDVNVTDEDDFLSRSMMIKANNKIICYLTEDQSRILGGTSTGGFGE